jgi:serine/threonine protein kinase
MAAAGDDVNDVPTITPAGGGAAGHPTLRVVDEDRYELGREIARGGMGAIFEARDVRLDRRVAIKELLPRDEETRDP